MAEERIEFIEEKASLWMSIFQICEDFLKRFFYYIHVTNVFIATYKFSFFSLQKLPTNPTLPRVVKLLNALDSLDESVFHPAGT